MMNYKILTSIVVGLLVLLWLHPLGRTCFSAEPGGKAGHLEEEETTGPLVTDTTIPQEKGTASLFVPVALAVRGGRFNSHWGRTSSNEDFVSLQVSPQLYYGLADKTEIYIVIPYQYNRACNAKKTGPGGRSSADSGGLGDLSFSFKYLLTGEKAQFPAVSSLFSVSFPTGSSSQSPASLGTDSIGSGAFTFTGGLNVYKFLPPVKLYGNLWYTISTAANVDGRRTHPPDALTVNLAAEYPLTKRWVLLSEMISTWDTQRLLGQNSDQAGQSLISVLPGLEYITGGRSNFAVGVQIDLLGRNTDFNYTPMIAFFHEF